MRAPAAFAAIETREAEFDSVFLTDTCIGCGALWEGEGCARCGLARVDAGALLAQACADFSLARTNAQAGRFADAERYSEAARAGGLVSHPAVKHLGDLCDRVQGKKAEESTRGDYHAARKAAQRGELFEAAIRAEQSALEDPVLLPAHKLRILCLAAMGRGEEAEKIRRSLLRDLPEEPDLLRWQFAPPVRRTVPKRLSAPVSRKAIRLPVPLPVPVQAPKRLEWVSLGGAILGVAAFSVSAVTALRPAPPVIFTLPTTVSSDIPARIMPRKIPASTFTLPVDLQRDFDEMQMAQVEQQARRWQNEAVSAFRRREWVRAERLASAAFEIGPKTYLAEDALLLRAKAADNQHEARAVGLYIRLADVRPQSLYAPVALAAAMQAAKRFGNKRQGESLRVRLLNQYPNSAQARRLKGMIEQ